MNWLWELSILDGALPWIIGISGFAGLAWLILFSRKRYLLVVPPVAAAVAVALVFGAEWLIEDVWTLFYDPIPTECYFWSGVAVFAALLMIPRLVMGSGRNDRIITVLAAIFAIVMSLSAINGHFSQYPTLGSVLGINHFKTISLEEASRTDLDTVDVDNWKNPHDLPSEGRIVTASIPPTASNFAARPAKIYLPPAYFSHPRPLLPVLVLMAGQPGTPQDWLVGGLMPETMDDYANHHDGLAPIVVVADATGGMLANPLCMDSKLGNVATYLSQDVPNWVKTNLQVDADARAWAIGGLSYGGTCALQMTTNHPQIYPTFLDVSGQLEPTLGTREQTVDAAFGGDEAKYIAINPMDLLKTEKYPGVAGAFVVGEDDDAYRPGLTQVYDTAEAAGLDVHFSTLPGGHSFAVWSVALKLEMPWLGARLGLPGAA